MQTGNLAVLVVVTLITN